MDDVMGNGSGVSNAMEAIFFPRLLGQRIAGLRYLTLGACQVGYLASFAAESDCKVDHMLYDSAEHSVLPDIDFTAYDGVVVGLTFRHLVSQGVGGAYDVEFFRIADEQRLLEALDATIALVEDRVARISAAIETTPVFFLSFQEPTFNYSGNLIGRYASTSPIGFMRAINAALERCLSRYANFHLLDVNEGLAALGAARLHDDIGTSFSHASLLGDYDELSDQGRLVASTSIAKALDAAGLYPWIARYLLGTLADNIKILRQIETVKLIIVDLDDTLWRGVAAEENVDKWTRTEGWPSGFVEALLIFKSRGGLLAISSKNDRDPTLQRLQAIWGDRIGESDFASIKIGWDPKSTSIAEILAETNILPENTLFIDDNPREIDEVRAVYGDMRFLGGSHYDWRRIILRSPETQVPFISRESRVRTELVQAKISRDACAQKMSHDDWLRSLDIAMAVQTISHLEEPDCARCVELLNKTNQFNTTGERWDHRAVSEFFDGGGVMLSSSLKDKTVNNGTIGVALVMPGQIVQMVLSCRVFGLGAELAMGSVAVDRALRGSEKVRARIVDTGSNFASHGVFASLGFQPDETGMGFVTDSAPPVPEWITVNAPSNPAASST